jgi:hypothetical protein
MSLKQEFPTNYEALKTSKVGERDIIPSLDSGPGMSNSRPADSRPDSFL